MAVTKKARGHEGAGQEGPGEEDGRQEGSGQEGRRQEGARQEGRAAKKAPAKKAAAKKAPGQEGGGEEGPGQEGRRQEGARQEGGGEEGTRQEGPGQEGAGQAGRRCSRLATADRRRGPPRPRRRRAALAVTDVGVDALCDDLTAEHDDLDRIVVGRRSADVATPAPGLDGPRPDQPPVVLRPAGAAGADRSRRVRASTPRRCWRRWPAPADPSVGGARRCPATSCSTAGARDRRRLVAARPHRRPEGPSARGTARRWAPARSSRARLMETWAHGQDVVDALGADRPPTDRLRHVAHIGVGARPFSYVANGRRAEPGAGARRARSARPATTWTWGPDDAADRVSGPALDFCLLVTQRRHRDDVDLVAEGPAADEWLDIAQAFAGPPGPAAGPASSADRSSEIGHQREDLGGRQPVRRAELGQAVSDPGAERRRARSSRRRASSTRTGSRGPRGRRAWGRRTP